MTEREEQLLQQWDRLDGAINTIATSQPHQMTEAIHKLTQQQRQMRAHLADWMMAMVKDRA